MRHRANLDILRSFAVCTVLIDHAAATIKEHPGYGNLAVTDFMAEIGQSGVTAFFVLTSLVLMDSLERMHASGKRVTVPFYIRRVFRIYPLAIFSVVLALLFHIPANTWSTPDPITRAGIVADLLLVQNVWVGTNVLAPMWSLPYEVQMYVVLPLLYLIASTRRAVWYVGGLLVFACVFGVVLAEVTHHLNMAAYLPCFLSGILCYALRKRVKPVIPAVMWPVFLVLMIVAFCEVVLSFDSVYWLVWIFSLVLGLSINVFQESRFKAANAVAAWIARYSYGMYLLHVPAFYVVFLRMHMQNIGLGLALALGITLAASVVTYHLLEKPLDDLGHRLGSV